MDLEAEVSEEEEDISSGDDDGDDDGSLEGSFIDDDTQLTQAPATQGLYQSSTGPCYTMVFRLFVELSN